MEETWLELRNELTFHLGICQCQRKIKSIVDNLHSIKEKCLNKTYDFTGAEWLLIALLNAETNLFLHGINCEYPMVNLASPFWEWVDKAKDNPNLTNN